MPGSDQPMIIEADGTPKEIAAFLELWLLAAAKKGLKEKVPGRV